MTHTIICVRCSSASHVEPAAVGWYCRNCDIAFDRTLAERSREWARRVALAGARSSQERREVEELFASEVVH